MESEQPPSSIEQWYDRTIVLDSNLRESKREEEKLRERREQRPQAPRLNNIETPRQQLLWPQV